MGYLPVRDRPLTPALGEVQVRAASPFALRSVDEVPTTTLCMTRYVSGNVRRVLADTVVMDIKSPALQPRADEAMPAECPTFGRVAFVVGADARVTSKRVSTIGTLAVIGLGVTALVVLFNGIRLDFGGGSSPP